MESERAIRVLKSIRELSPQIKDKAYHLANYEAVVPSSSRILANTIKQIQNISELEKHIAEQIGESNAAEGEAKQDPDLEPETDKKKDQISIEQVSLDKALFQALSAIKGISDA